MAEKCQRAKGNFYTLRDLLLKGYKASAIRLALISVPYRHQLNFTFDGLVDATAAIDRLRTFYDRLVKGSFPAGEKSGCPGRCMQRLMRTTLLLLPMT